MYLLFFIILVNIYNCLLGNYYSEQIYRHIVKIQFINFKKVFSDGWPSHLNISRATPDLSYNEVSFYVL